MDEVSPGGVTQLLAEWQHGDDRALEQFMPLVYGELRRLAGRYLNHEREGHTLETHDLIHEAFLRLAVAGLLEKLFAVSDPGEARGQSVT